MRTVKVLALSGWAKSGKDTSCDYLVAERGYVKVSFADELKVMVADQYDIPLYYLHDQEKKEMPLLEYPVSPKDSFTADMAKTLHKEFRTADGEAARLPYYQNTEQLYYTPRALAIMEGSVKRSANPNYWVDKVVKKIYDGTSKKYVISDYRYRNEGDVLRKAFGDHLYTVRIERFTSTQSVDASELDLVGHPHDVTIGNTGSLDDLYKKLKGL